MEPATLSLQFFCGLSWFGSIGSHWACIIQTHGIFRWLGRGTGLSALVSCSLPKWPHGLGEATGSERQLVPQAGPDVVSCPDPGGGSPVSTP